MKIGPERVTRDARSHSVHFYEIALVCSVQTDDGDDLERVTVEDTYISENGSNRTAIDQGYIDGLLERHDIEHGDIVDVDQFYVRETTNMLYYPD